MRERESGSNDLAGDDRSDRVRKPMATAVCDLCGGPMIERHCKITCENCGYQRDCSDP